MTAETSNARGLDVEARQAWYEQQIALAETQWAADFLDMWECGDDVPCKEHFIALWLAERRAPHEAPALSQQPEARGVVDEEVTFNAAFFVSRTGNRIEQLTNYDDYRRDGALLALMDLGQKRASARGLTKKGGGKVTTAWVTAPQIVECDAALTEARNG